MGSSGALADFVAWARNAYPAEHYALVLWDHGGGFNGVCFDDADADDLSMADVASALGAAPQLSVLGFDACLMGMAEVAYQVRHEAQVLVASEETIPWDGYEYQNFLNYLVADPNLDARALAGRMLDAYQARYDSEGDCTLAAVDLTQLGSATTGLAGALDDFAATMLGAATAADWTAVQEARNAAQAWSTTTFRDLGDFMQRVSTASVSSAIAAAAENVLGALDETVIRAYDGPSVASTGLSIYVPAVGGSIGSLYSATNLQFVADTRWDDFLGQMLINHVGSTAWTDVAESARYWETSRRSRHGESVEAESVDGIVAPSSAADPGDWYRLNVAAGDTLTFTTATPAAGSGEFVNTFNPYLELYDASGLLLTADDNSLDGRNARLQHTALTGGTYWIRVAPSPLEPGKGEYFLGVEGATGGLPAFNALATDLDGIRFSVTPTAITVDFGDLVLLSSVAAADVRIDGLSSAAIASIPDGDSLVFQLPTGLVEGWHTVSIAPGAIADLQGTPIAAFSSQFYLDFTAPRIIASTLLAGDVVPLGSLLYTLSFSEPLSDSGLDASDVVLVGQRTGSYAATAVYYDRASITLTVRFAGLADDRYTLTLYSGNGQLEDVAGNDLDGSPSFPLPSGDGTPGGNFVLSFAADLDTLFFPGTFAMLEPGGGLVYSGAAEALLYSSSDRDRFTFELAAGQRLTVIADPATAFAPILELYGPDAGLLASSTAAVGQNAVLRSVLATTDGTYTLAVASGGGSPGTFAIQALINAGLEREGSTATNDTPGTAEDLDGTIINLGPVRRGAVVGTSDPSVDLLADEIEPNGTLTTANPTQNNFLEEQEDLYHLGIAGAVGSSTDADWFKIGALNSGDVISISQSGTPSSRGTLADPFVYLYRYSSGSPVLVTSNNDNGPGADALIYNYTIGTADTYYVVADANSTYTGTYALALWLRNSGAAPGTGGTLSAETEANDSAATANDASASWRPVQYRAQTSGTITSGDADLFAFRFTAGDLVSVNIDSTSTMDAQVEVLDAAGATVAAESGSSGPGYDSPLYGYCVPTTGTYYLRVRPNSGTGTYTANVYLSTFTASCLPSAAYDYYAFSLASGETVTVAVQGDTAGLLQVDLTDASGAVLASGLAADGPDAVIHNFSATAGTYYARVGSVRKTDYRLVMARNADLDTEPNDSLASAQELGPSGTVVGSPTSGGVLYVADAATDAIYALDPVTGASLLIGSVGYNVDMSGLAYDGRTLYVCDLYSSAWSLGSINLATGAGTIIGAQNDTLIDALAFKDGLLYGFSAERGVGTVNTSTGVFSPITNSLSVLMIAADCDERTGTVYAIGADNVLYTIDVSAGTATAVGATGVSFSSYAGLAWSPVDRQLYAIGNSSAADSLYRIDKTTGAATLIAVTTLTMPDGLEFIPGISFDSLTRQVDEGADGIAALDTFVGGDCYRFSVTAGEPIYLATSTPGGGVLTDNLDPRLELYDPSGTLIAADDNGAGDGRNASVLLTAPVTGVYTVRLLAASGDTGEYMLTRVGTPTVVSGTSSDVLEGGAGDTYRVVLGMAPTAPVTVQLDSGSQILAVDDVNPANAFLTFTPDNWMTPQTVRLSAVDDGLLEGNGKGTVIQTLVSTDVRYAGRSAALTVNVFDNDEAMPLAAADTYRVAVGAMLQIDRTQGVLANDSDADLQALSAVTTPVEGPFHAAAFELHADGSFTYVPAAGFSGTDWFTYRAFDGWCASQSPAKATIHVEGPQLLRDINFQAAGSTPQNLVEINGIAFFVATDREHGTELWRSDGTAEGTVLVKDIYPGSSSSSLNYLVNFNGTLFFRASTSANGAELWRSDGTATGTSMVMDLTPGSISSAPTSLTPVGNVLFFAAMNSSNGTELWRTDGTSAGTKMVADICAGSGTSNPANLRNLNGVLLFTASDGANGTELWRSDGTAAGTQMVLDIQSGSSSSAPATLTVVGNRLFFLAGDGTTGVELWSSDGTGSGTALVKDIRPGVNSSSPANLAGMGGILYFTANDGTSGIELWRSNGSEAGTYLVKDIRSGTSSSNPSNLTALGSTLFFSASNGSNGTELWRSDGTDPNTVMVKDIVSAGGSSSPSNLCAVGAMLYFSAIGPTGGRELWRSDGTEEQTVLVSDIRPGNDSSSPGWLSNIRGTLMFSASDANGNVELWRSDDSGAGTRLVADIYRGGNGCSPNALIAIGDQLLFGANDAIIGSELWLSNGTNPGTGPVKDIYSGSGGWSSSVWANVNGILYFPAYESTHGWELWRSNGTAEGTSLVKDIYPGNSGSISSSTTALCAANGILYFWANDGASGTELWRSDGTEAGTCLVKDLTAGSVGSTTRDLSASPYYLFSSGSLVFFSIIDSSLGFELWRSDGTADGTFLVKDICPGTGNSYITNPASVNGILYFQATDGTNGYELWRSDGTAAGTWLVKDICAGSGSSSPAYLTNVNGTLFFRAYEGTTGTELWRSDGTAAGTYVVKDLYSGGSSNPSNLTNVKRLRAVRERRHGRRNPTRQGHLGRDCVIRAELDCECPRQGLFPGQ
jgi:ELWxxDGT repeat protein